MGAGKLFNHFADAGNVGVAETDLYSDLTAAGVLGLNGDELRARYAGSIVGHATNTRRIRVYFAGTVVLDTGAVVVTVNQDWQIDVRIMRESAAAVRVIASVDINGTLIGTSTTYTAIGGLTLANTNILKITGLTGAGGANNDIVAKIGTVEKVAGI